MYKKVLLIYNPVAGKATVPGKLSTIIESFSRAGSEVTVHPILPGNGAEEVLAARGDAYDLVVCCGGDGTLNHTVNGLMRMKRPPLFGYLPSGSTNDFARSLELPQKIEDGCAAILEGSPFFYDIGSFNDRHFNYVAAFGAFTDVSYLTPQNDKNALGHLAYLIEGVKRLPIGQHFPARVECGGESWVGDYLYGAVSNSTSVGGIQMGRPEEVSLDDGEFEVLLIKAPANVAETSAIAGKLLTREFDGELVRLLRTDSIRFTFTEKTAWTLDGEFGGEVREAEIRVCPRALGILRKQA